MARRGLSLALAGLLAWAAVPGSEARAEGFGDSSDGAAIAAGLAIAVVAVYGLVALRSDVESYSDAGGAIDRAVAAAEASPVVLEALCGDGGKVGGGAVAEGVAVGWKVSF